jgi:hypothetical protein
MELLSLDQAQPRIGKPIPVAMSAVGEGTARNFQSAARAGLRAASSAAKSHGKTPRSSSYCVASLNLHSPLRFVADMLVIGAPSVLSRPISVIPHAFPQTACFQRRCRQTMISGTIARTQIWRDLTGYSGILREIAGPAASQTRPRHVA